jgi:type IV secretory pathway protease TraF
LILYLVKRVVGLPGDAIALENNHLLVNGEEVAYEPVDQSNPGTPVDVSILRTGRPVR